MMLHRKDDRREYIAMEFRRFITSVILIPALVIRHARSITIRPIGYTPSLGRFFSAWHTIERTGFGEFAFEAWRTRPTSNQSLTVVPVV